MNKNEKESKWLKPATVENIRIIPNKNKMYDNYFRKHYIQVETTNCLFCKAGIPFLTMSVEEIKEIEKKEMEENQNGK